MKEKDEMRELFGSFDWNTEEPNDGHELRFLQKLDRPRRKKQRMYGVLSIAASVIILLGIFLTRTDGTQEYKMSPENKEAQQFFASVIKKELNGIKSENSPAVKGMVDDAMKQIDAMEADYNKLASELAKKGENEQLIFAMITNLKKRIEFLERVNHQIETIKRIKSESQHDENRI